RLRIEAAITWSLFGRKHTRLPFKTKNRPVNIGLAREYAGGVDQVARRKIVGAIGNDVELAKQLQRIGASQLRVECAQIQKRIDRPQFVGGGVKLLAAYIGGRVDDLALQVRVIHDVEIHDAARADACSRQIERKRRPETARSDAQNFRSLQLLLPLHAHLGHDQMA